MPCCARPSSCPLQLPLAIALPSNIGPSKSGPEDQNSPNFKSGVPSCTSLSASSSVCSNIALPSIPNSPLLSFKLDSKDRIFGERADLRCAPNDLTGRLRLPGDLWRRVGKPVLYTAAYM